MPSSDLVLSNTFKSVEARLLFKDLCEIMSHLESAAPAYDGQHETSPRRCCRGHWKSGRCHRYQKTNCAGHDRCQPSAPARDIRPYDVLATCQNNPILPTTTQLKHSQNRCTTTTEHRAPAVSYVCQVSCFLHICIFAYFRPSQITFKSLTACVVRISTMPRVALQCCSTVSMHCTKISK